MEQPKKPTGGAYGQFLAEKRSEFQKLCEGQPITAVTKLAGEKFRALGEEEKAVYQKKFQEAQAKYDVDMKAFLDAGGEKKTTQRKGKNGKEKGKKVKDPDAPKQPAGGAYGCFLAKNRPTFMKECAGQPVTAVTKLASAKWKELSAEEKKIFEDEFQAKKAAYQEAMKSYVPKAPEAEEAEEVEPPAKKSRKADKAEKTQAKAEKAEKAEKSKAEKSEKSEKAKTSTKAKKSSEAEAVELQATVAAKAEKLGLKDGLLKLAARPDVKASGKSQNAMLKALEENRGLLHPAKRALLGAWRRMEDMTYSTIQLLTLKVNCSYFASLSAESDGNLNSGMPRIWDGDSNCVLNVHLLRKHVLWDAIV